MVEVAGSRRKAPGRSGFRVGSESAALAAGAALHPPECGGMTMTKTGMSRSGVSLPLARCFEKMAFWIAWHPFMDSGLIVTLRCKDKTK